MKSAITDLALGTSGINGTNGINQNVTCATNAANALCHSCLSVDVSCFRDYNTTDNPVSIPLMTWLKSTKYRDTVERIRSESDKATRDKLKATLPAVTISGIFSKRNSESLVKHSRLIAVDIDAKENAHIGNYSELKEQLCRISNVAYCGLSVSGTGYFAIIPIAYPDKHLEHFMALERSFQKLGIVIDHKCKNIDRLRGYSYDAHGYFNPNAKVFAATYQPPRPKRIVYNPSGDNDAANVESCLNQLTKDITGDYGTWFEIGCSLATAFGESGRQYFHQVSRFYEGYTQRETDKQYDHCLKGYGKITLATFFYYMKLAGIEPQRTERSTTAVTIQSKEQPIQEYALDGTPIGPKGYPVSWDIPSTPLDRLCRKNPHLGTLMDRLQLGEIG